MSPLRSRQLVPSMPQMIPPDSTPSTVCSTWLTAGSAQAIRVVAIGPNVSVLGPIVYAARPVLQPVST